MSLPTLDNLAPKEAGGAATKFPGIVADLDTRPNAIGGLSAAELKAKFDEAARVIQNYINNVLLPALLSSGATSIGYQTSSDLPDYQPSTVDDALSGLENLVASLLPIKVNGKVCFCNNLTIPASGSISVAYNSIYPRPLVGDYVVNQNGEMGHITSVVIGDVVTVTAANYTLKAVLTDETQNLSATQKARARSNIGALGPADTEAKYVKYDDYASYTDTQKATARANIGALEKANPHVETGMTVDGVLDAEGGIEAYDDVTVEGALTVKNASQERGVSLSQTAAAVLSFAGATPQTRPVLRNIGTPVLNNDAANKAFVVANGISETAKLALLNCFAHVAWVDEHGQDYYDELEAALMARTLESITAVFVQGDNVIYDTDSLDDLKPMLTVTAYYDDGTSATVTAYTLSGTLAEGPSTITVMYSGKTATFTVTVTAVLYNLENQTINTNEQILTNLNLLQNDFPFTILFDFTNTANPTSGSTQGVVAKYLFEYNSGNTNTYRGIAIGKADSRATVLSSWWNSDTRLDLTGTSPAPGRHRIALTHEANSNDLNIKYKGGNGQLLTFTHTNPFTTTEIDTFSLGGGGNHNLPTGNLKLARIYGEVISDDRIANFFE